MGLFTQDTEIKKLPQSKESKAGSQYLQGILGTDTTIPQQQVAGLTPLQQELMKYLSGMVSGMQNSSGLAEQTYTDILSGSNYQQNADQLKKDFDWATQGGINQIRRGANLGGMLNATNTRAQEGAFLNQAESVLMNELNNLMQQDTSNKMNAAQGLEATQANKASNVSNVMSLADTQRIIEQSQNDAIYQQLLMQVLFPYEYQASIANSLLNYKDDYAITGGGPTGLASILGMGASALGGFAGTEAGAGALINALPFI